MEFIIVGSAVNILSGRSGATEGGCDNEESGTARGTLALTRIHYKNNEFGVNTPLTVLQESATGSKPRKVQKELL